MEKQNRAERRRSKFGGGRTSEHGGWPTSQPNPALRAGPIEGDASADETAAVTPDQDETAAADAGADAATDQAGQTRRREGTPAKTRSKG